MEELKQGFIDEALQLCEKLESLLLDLNDTPPSEAEIQEIFRIMHTLKGSSAMFGFSNIQNLSHSLEDVYELIREQKLLFDETILILTFNTNDILKELLNNNDNVLIISNNYEKTVLDIRDFLKEHIENYNKEQANIKEISIYPEEAAQESTETLYYVFFKPDKDILQRGVSPIDIFDELVEIGSINGFPYTDEVPAPEDYDPATFFLGWDIFVKTTGSIEDIEDCFMFYLDHEYKIIPIDSNSFETNKVFLKTCLHIRKGNNAIIEIKEKLSLLTGKTKDKTPPIEDVLETKNSSILKDNNKKIESIKVESNKLDELINLVSELVTLNSRLEIQTEQIEDNEIRKTISSISKLSKKFRDNALNLRLIPVRVLILKLQRLIRDVSISLGKEVEFITQGTETELDKNIIAKLEAPLLHIIRNSIDHGIESSSQRISKGKPAKGLIRFIAFYSGSNVFIQIQDDGNGIDIEKVKHKAIEKGIIKETEDLEKSEIFNLLFTPGFSTAKQVTNISGRGVGLDVVKKEITDMRGEIDIESEKGLGTSFTLKLPLTLSIIDTLRVKVHNFDLLIPREFIIQTSIYLSSTNSFLDKLEYEKEIIPVISLRNEFNSNLKPLDKQYNIVIKHSDKYYALQVDKIIGEHQAVVKPLGHYNQDNSYFSGGSILGDGSLAFILDLNKLISIKKNTNKLGNYNLK